KSCFSRSVQKPKRAISSSRRWVWTKRRTRSPRCRSTSCRVERETWTSYPTPLTSRRSVSGVELSRSPCRKPIIGETGGGGGGPAPEGARPVRALALLAGGDAEGGQQLAVVLDPQLPPTLLDDRDLEAVQPFLEHLAPGLVLDG